MKRSAHECADDSVSIALSVEQTAAIDDAIK